MDVLTFVCLCSVEIIRKRFQGMPVIQFIKFPANVEYFVFILVSERKTNRQTCHKMLFSMSSMSTTLTQRVPFRCLVLPSHGVNFCPHVSSILIHKEVFHLKETPELHTSRVRFATSFWRQRGQFITVLLENALLKRMISHSLTTVIFCALFIEWQSVNTRWKYASRDEDVIHDSSETSHHRLLFP